MDFCRTGPSGTLLASLSVELTRRAADCAHFRSGTDDYTESMSGDGHQGTVTAQDQRGPTGSAHRRFFGTRPSGR